MSSSTSSGQSGDQALAALLADYKRPATRDRFKGMAARTKTECEEMLARMGINGIVTCRTKKPASLEKKLQDNAQELGEWAAAQKQDLYRHPDMGDLAGVRIGLYLPGDVVKVAEEIPRRFDERHRFGTVLGGRDAPHLHERNLDPLSHNRGPFRSHDFAAGGEYWQNSGYKSWQVVVKWRRPAKSLPYDLRSVRVEIQVGTLVSQAWAEIQHSIIYKRPDDIRTTVAMTRMIDISNGLQVNAEIALQQLEDSLEEARKEAEMRRQEAEERDRRDFRDGAEFMAWFQSTYMNHMGPEEQEDWVSRQDPDTAAWLVWACSDMGRPAGMFTPHACPAEFRELIAKNLLLQPDGTTPMPDSDIAQALIFSMGPDITRCYAARWWGGGS